MNESQRSRVWDAAGWLGIALGGGAALLCGAFIVLVSVQSARGLDITVHGTSYLPRAMRLLYDDARILPTLFLVGATLALTAGIGLVRRRAYGRSLTLVFACCSIAWFVFATVNTWLVLLRPSSDAPSLLFRLGPVISVTPVAVAYCIGVALLGRSVYLHPEAFRRPPSGLGA